MHMLCLSLYQPWDCTSFLKLSSKCATSPVSCCWDSGIVGSGEGVGGGGACRGVRKGVETAERRVES